MITNTILCSLLVSWNLIQFSLAIPIPFDSNEDYLKGHDLCQQRQNYADMAPGDKDSSIAPTIQLLKITLYSLQDLTLTYARKAKIISELLLKDPALNENHSEEVENFKQRINNFLKTYSSCSGMEELLNLIELYAMFISDYYNMEEENILTADGKIILDVLKKYDSKKVDVELERQFIVFASKFAKKFEELEDDLQKEKGELPGKIMQWWETAKNAKGFDDQFTEFGRFMRLYKDNK